MPRVLCLNDLKKSMVYSTAVGGRGSDRGRTRGSRNGWRAPHVVGPDRVGGGSGTGPPRPPPVGNLGSCRQISFIIFVTAVVFFFSGFIFCNNFQTLYAPGVV